MPKKQNVYSGRGLAKRCGVSEKTIRTAEQKGLLIKIKKGEYKGKYDLADETNLNGIQAFLTNTQCGDKRTPQKKTKSKTARKTKSKYKAKNDLDTPEEDIDNINDFSFLRNLKEREAIREKQIKNKKLRGELVNKKTVAQVFNKLWSVDSSQLIPIGTKLSPEICSICKVDDSEVITRVRELIDKEIWRVLGHCKRIMSDYLSNIGSDNIEEIEDEEEE